MLFYTPYAWGKIWIQIIKNIFESVWVIWFQDSESILFLIYECSKNVVNFTVKQFSFICNKSCQIPLNLKSTKSYKTFCFKQ